MDEAELAARRQARRKKVGWKRPRRIFSLWARVGMAVAVIVVSIFLAINLIAKAARPYREAGIQKSQLSATVQRSDALATENAALARRIMYLKSPQGIASEARKMGYLRPGEIPMVVEGSAERSLDRTVPAAPRLLPSRSGDPIRKFWSQMLGH